MHYIKSLLKKLVGQRIAAGLQLYWEILQSCLYRSCSLVLTDDNELNLHTRVFDDSNHQVFFGYYDISPFSADESLLLAMHVSTKSKVSDHKNLAKIGFYNLNEETPFFNKIDSTMTWCWQQGCRLQWYPANSTRTVLFNTLIGDHYGCIVKDINHKAVIKQIPRPIYAVSKDGKWGLSINFSRLQRLRPGYGYDVLHDDTYGDISPINDGIWLIDMSTGIDRLLFSINEIANYQRVSSMEGAEHYFNHLLFNYSASRFLFVHLWIKEGKRFSRLLTVDYNGSNIYVVNNEGHSSHYTWKSDTQLLVYATHQLTGLHYYLYEDMTQKRQIIGKNKLVQDGHPVFLPNSDAIITDTYPDKCRNQSLLFYDIKKSELKKLGKFYIPSRFSGEIRCDLHPRLSPSGSYLCIDNIHQGKRVMTIIDLRPLREV